MREIVIHIPDIEPEQNIEIDVRINGRKRSIYYRVELVSCEDAKASSEDRIAILRHKISTYNKDWRLVQIGAPMKDKIPIMFRKMGS